MSCEDDLARARMTLEDMRGYLKVAIVESQSLEREYLRLSILVNGRPNTGTGLGPIGGGSAASGPPRATGTAGGDGKGATTESRPAAGASPVTLLQKRSATLGERLARLEAKV